ncbi:hypothetical protein GCM10028803_40610 [Larkinella knui]
MIGGAFENREYMYQGMPDQIASTDTSPGWGQAGQKLVITGTIYRIDGKTPAPEVVLYYYHTTIEGRYVHKPGEKRTMLPNALGQTHGYIRGWVKTDKSGKYTIYTVRPGTYPSRDEPAHIHLTIKEPAIDTPYYIDEFIFDDDQLLTPAKRKKLENRGGSGILRVLVSDNLQIAEHNIILGLHVPNYPQISPTQDSSGLSIGEDQPSFTPFHAFGPDKGTRTCPVCKYGRYHGIIYFVGNNPDWTRIKRWITFLERQSRARKKYLKAYFVYGNEQHYEKSKRQQELEKIGLELQVKQVALTFVPSFSDTVSEANLNKINPGVENTFIVFKNRAIIDKYINLAPTTVNFNLLSKVLDQTQGSNFKLAEPEHH